MFDQYSRQRKQRAWKTINLNLNNLQEQPQYNRSIIADSAKRYCPRKNSSHQKIFSKSKQRLNLSKLQNNENQTFFFMASKQPNGNSSMRLSTQNSHNYHTYHKNTQDKRNNKYQQIAPHQQRTSTQKSYEVQQGYQTDQNQNSIRKSNQIINQQFEQVLSSSKLKAHNIHSYTFFYQRINQNASILSELKEQFETFKQIVLKQLEEEKKSLRQYVLKMTDEFIFIREKIREDVYAELQIRGIPIDSSFKQNLKNTTDFRLQEILNNKNLQRQDLEGPDSFKVINFDTFAKIQHPNDPDTMLGEKMQGTKKIENNKINTSEIKEEKISQQIAENSLFQIKSAVSKMRIDETDQMQRYSQMLKKQYQEKTRNSVQVSKLDKEKINQRLNHVSKFQGAMQKLKSEIMEFKNLSDTTSIKKIKFSQQKSSQKHLKQTKPNQIIDPQIIGNQISKKF